MQDSLIATLQLAQRALLNSSDLVFKDPQLAHLRDQALGALQQALTPAAQTPIVSAEELLALRACFQALSPQDGYVADPAVDLAEPSLAELLPFEEAAFMPLDMSSEDTVPTPPLQVAPASAR